jgi:uncharacterized membrane protein YgcG
MRKLFIVTLLLLSLFIAACSKQTGLGNVNERSALVSTAGNASSTTTASGKGRPISSAIDDAPAAPSEAKSPLPSPTGFVNDYAKVIDGETKEDLEATIGKLKENSKIEFAVVTVDTTGDKSGNDYADAVARGWGIGPKDGSGGGLILLIAVKDRRWVLRWSRSLMDDLQDGTEDELQRLLTEPFRQGKYSEGIRKGVEAVISRLAERRGFSTD